MERFKGRLLLFSQIALMILIVVSPLSKSIKFVGVLIGILLILLASVLFIFAKRDLKEAFHPLPEPKPNAPLMTSGIYSRIRHPMYTSFLLGALGISLIKQNLLTSLTSILLFLVLNIKYRFEDSLLRGVWKQAEPYQSQTPALIPRLRKS